MSFLENCRKLVGLDSTPSHGNLAAAEFAGQLCIEAGLQVEFHRETMAGVDQCNVIARPQSGIPVKEFLLQTHLDTVDAGHFSHWTKTQANPFNASIYNDVIFGLGTADAKLDFLCKLEAVKPLVGKKMKLPFVLVGTFGGAESSMGGAVKLIRKKKINPVLALIGEPTQMRLVNSGTGLASVEVMIPFSQEEIEYRRSHDLNESTSTQSRIFTGKAAHSSDPGAGQNAIMIMLEYLTQLPEGIAVMDLDGGHNNNSVPAHAILEIDTVAGFRDPILPKISRIYKSLLNLQEELRGFTEPGFSPPHPTMNIGRVRSDEDGIILSGSCRLPPSVTDAIYEGWMRNLNMAVQEVGATFRVKDYKRGFAASPETDFVKGAQSVLEQMGLNSKLQKLAQTTEANVFHRMGAECLVWGPGQSVGNSHAPNESIRIADLRQAAEFYSRLLERFCL